MKDSPYPIFNLDEMQNAGTEDAPRWERVYKDAFAEAIGNGYYYAMLIPSAEIPSTPYDMGIDYRGLMGFGGQHEERLTAPIVLGETTLAEAGDWILLFNMPY